MPSTTLYTIGHSTRAIDEFLAMLRACSIALVVDVRTVPKSRRNPQYVRESLQASLAEAGVDYRHMKSLGGLRKPAPDSVNSAWRNASFRGYADYMQTPEYAQAVDELIALAAGKRTALMCAEAVPWRCHRSLIGDTLLVRGFGVINMIGIGQSKRHELTSFAHVEGTRITYPPAQSELPL